MVSGPTTDGFSAVVVGAITAAAGYVGKLVVGGVLDYQKGRRARRSRLVELRSLLRTTRTSFIIQNQHAARLLNMLQEHDPHLILGAAGYESTFASKYMSFSTEEKELHEIIRGITVHAMKSTNMEILGWIRRDTYFRGRRRGKRKLGSFADCLSDLHTHLLLWLAKYETWIPNRPEHALVYLDDEQKHGVGFPKQIDEAVEELLSDM
jgi:hypothetical protein